MIKKRYEEILESIKLDPYYKNYMGSGVYFLKSSIGSWEGLHVYEEDGYYLLDYCERGRISSIVKSENEDIVFYELVSNVIFNLALDFEKHNRVEGLDFRRIFFSRYLELIEKYIPEHAPEKRNYYDSVLKVAPYSDSLNLKPIIKKIYDEWDPLQLIAMGAPSDEYKPEIDDLFYRLDNKVLSVSFIMEQIYAVGKYWFSNSYLLSLEDGRKISQKIIEEIKKTT